MLRFQGVGKRYPGSGEILKGLDLAVERGDMAFITGHSGAGKSTVLKLAALIERPSRGRIFLNDRDLTRLPSRSVPYLRRRIGLIFQDYRLLYDRSVFDNVALPLQIAGYAPEEIERRTRAALAKVGLAGCERRGPVTLSGGEQQRVGIARAIVTRPPLILADEPTGNLDPDLSQEIFAMFRDFNRVGVTFLIASHDQGLVERFASRWFHLEQGRVVEVG
ncbi:cell division transport system ATP-binding protein [Methylomarinovum caldicuralii]|uniref:Cell division ATP-binding protein FtsE n=1 Tax=Methylomarinovum caldicuralii TaxID=438856 RepID=A0AAU9CL59_9GAMM|nr:ATP-binding cassette domain-containing protein [Methylomarinovum caldicuralii]BCX82396.1 cell division transport system ATP-binding protein [Methylomarinovum caldicuralii]